MTPCAPSSPRSRPRTTPSSGSGLARASVPPSGHSWGAVFRALRGRARSAPGLFTSVALEPRHSACHPRSERARGPFRSGWACGAGRHACTTHASEAPGGVSSVGPVEGSRRRAMTGSRPDATGPPELHVSGLRNRTSRIGTVPARSRSAAQRQRWGFAVRSPVEMTAQGAPPGEKTAGTSETTGLASSGRRRPSQPRPVIGTGRCTTKPRRRRRQKAHVAEWRSPQRRHNILQAIPLHATIAWHF